MDPGLAPPPAPRPPRAWPARLPGSACPVPAPARRSPAVLPSPAPRPLSSSRDSAWGFAGFWEIKTASNSGGAPPGQTGLGGPCAPGYRPRPGRREGAAGRAPSAPAPVLPPKVGGPCQKSRAAARALPRFPAQVVGGWWRPPAKLSLPPGLWVTVAVSPGRSRPLLVKLVGSALGLRSSLPRICKL